MATKLVIFLRNQFDIRTTVLPLGFTAIFRVERLELKNFLILKLKYCFHCSGADLKFNVMHNTTNLRSENEQCARFELNLGGKQKRTNRKRPERAREGRGGKNHQTTQTISTHNYYVCLFSRDWTWSNIRSCDFERS